MEDLEFNTSYEWIIIEPGVLNLHTTNISVVMSENYGFYYVSRNNKPVTAKGMYYTIEAAKKAAIQYKEELMNMGFEP